MTRLIDLHEVNKTDACKVELLSFYEVELQKKLQKKHLPLALGKTLFSGTFMLMLTEKRKKHFRTSRSPIKC